MKRIKVIITSLLIVMLILAAGAVPIGAQAACSTPTCVKKAATAAMDENDINIAFVIKTDKKGKSIGYMMYRDKGRVKCDRSGTVIIGKNTNIRKNYHYYVYRNNNAEKKIISWTKNKIQHRTKWNTCVECAEDMDYGFYFHSYDETKSSGKAVWKVHKGACKNVDGVAMCEKFAHYLRSMLDPDCPVIFI